MGYMGWGGWTVWASKSVSLRCHHSRERESSASLTWLRSEIFAFPTPKWRVQELDEEVNMSACAGPAAT